MPTAVGFTSDSKTATDQVPEDEPSVRGRFCWAIVGNTCLPCLHRKDGTKYVSVRIAENKVLHRFLQYFNFEMFSCVSVDSYDITETETCLLNFINKEQCDNLYGVEKFSKGRDFIVKLEDLQEYYNFLETCYNKIIHVPTFDFKTNSRCGFIRINNESVVPYTVNNDTKYLPLFYFEGDTDHLKVNGTRIGGWDLAYLKFCCKVQGIRNELFANDHCLMISLQDVKSYFPEDTLFEDYWPPQIVPTPPKFGSYTNGNQHSWVLSPMVSSVPSTQSAPMPAVYSRPSNIRMNGCSTITSTQQSAANTNQYDCANRVVWPVTTSSVPVSQFNGYRNLDPSVNRITYAGAKTRPSVVTSTTAMSSGPAYVPRPTQPQQYGYPNNTENCISGSGSSAATISSVQQQQQLLHQQQQQRYQQQQQQINRRIQIQQQLSRQQQIRIMQQQQQHHHEQQQQQQQQHQPQQRQPPQQPPPTLTYNNNGLLDKAPANLPRIPTTAGLRQIAPATNGDASLRGKRTAPADATLSNEIIDLSSPPASPRSRNCAPENELMPAIGNDEWSAVYDNLPPLLPIDEIAPQAVHNNHRFPYTTQFFKHNNASLFCINIRPYAFSDMMIPLVDIVSLFAPTTVLEMRYKMQKILKISLYQPNKTQLQILKDNKKCESTNEEVPMITVSNFSTHFSRLKYIHDMKPRAVNQDQSKRHKLS